MKLSELAVKRPVTVLMLVFMVLILGIISYLRIPLDLMPEMEIPVAVVNTNYFGVGPQEIEKLITKPLEEAVGTVENIKSLKSISSEGTSLIITEFNYGTDMDNATLEMREKIDLVKGTLPEDAQEPMVFKFDPDAMPIMMLSISSEKLSMSDLQSLVEDVVQPRLERAPGVAQAKIFGGVEDIVEIRASSEKLQGYGISLDYLADILKAENLNLPGGSVQKGDQELTVKTSGEFESLEEIQQLLIPLPNGSTVLLNDIAEVELKLDEQSTISKAGGKPSIDIMIKKESGTNTVKVSEAAKEEIAALERELAGTDLHIIYDAADYIQKSLNRVYSNGMIGGLLAVLILYLFLRNFRTTFIIAAAIPISVIATFCLLYFSGVSLNMMTLGGLALGMGMLVDNSVVVLENIYRFRQDGYSRIEAAVKGSSEVSIALVASTLTTLAVFLPIVFVQGLTSTIFRQLAMTVSFSLLASLVVAVTLVPMLCSKLLKVEKRRTADGFKPVVEAEGGNTANYDNNKKGIFRSRELFDKVYRKFDEALDVTREWYRKLVSWALGRRWKVVIFAVIAFIGCMGSIALVGTEFFPTTDEGYVQIDVSLPDGSEVENTAALMDTIESKIEGIPEIVTVFIEAGHTQEMMMSAKGNKGTMYVKLRDLSERKRGVVEISDEIRDLLRDTPGAEIKVAPMKSFQMGTSSDPISISIEGEELDTLKAIGDDFVRIIKEIPGTREVKSSYEEGIPEVEINVDRKTAAQYGLTAGQIAQAVRGTISGTTATTYKYNGTEIDVKIKGDEHFKDNMLGLEQIPVSTPQGFMVTLGQVADIVVKRGPATINRDDQKRVVKVTSQLSGRDVGSVSKDIQKALSKYQMPDKYYYSMGGEQKEMVEAFSDLLLAFGLAVILVYMVMASQFESLLYPFVIMFSMPLGFAGGIFGLFLMGKPLNVPAFIGLIMLAGIVVNNAIVLVDYINTRRRIYNEERDTAVINAGPIRLRPILMTTLTTVLGMVPLALGIGEGSELSAPLAIVVVFGLSLSTLVTLVVVPVMYTLFDDLSEKIKGKIKGRKKPAPVIVQGDTNLTQ